MGSRKADHLALPPLLPQVEYEAQLRPGGPYSRGILPGQQRHLE